MNKSFFWFNLLARISPRAYPAISTLLVPMLPLCKSSKHVFACNRFCFRPNVGPYFWLPVVAGRPAGGLFRVSDDRGRRSDRAGRHHRLLRLPATEQADQQQIRHLWRLVRRLDRDDTGHLETVGLEPTSPAAATANQVATPGPGTVERLAVGIEVQSFLLLKKLSKQTVYRSWIV